VLVPAVVGVPLMTPVDGLMDSPGGWPLKDQVNVPVPPEAATGELYATPTCPPGSEAVVMMSFGAIVIENFFVAVCAVGVDESVTVTTTLLLVPAAVGVPLMTPVEGLMLSPVGWPLKAHVRVPTPFVAVTVVFG